MNPIAWFHGEYIFNRRVNRLSSFLAEAIPPNAKVLDIGAGDGSLDLLLMQQRTDIKITGLDVLVRPQTAIPVEQFDGEHIPFPDRSWDVAMFVDVLHHTGDALALLKEAARVARTIVIKDHLDNGLLSNSTLRLMDYVGNARHGVALPYDYWSRQRWTDAFAELGMKPTSWSERLGLYPVPLTFFFDRSLHFVARLERSAAAAQIG